MIEPGDTFDGYDPRRHLYVVLSAQTATGEVALIGLTSHYPDRVRHNEQCVVVEPHEHPWVRRDSCVFFPVTAMERIAGLEYGLAVGELQRHPRCSAALLKRMQAMVLSRSDIPARVRSAIAITTTVVFDLPPATP